MMRRLLLFLVVGSAALLAFSPPAAAAEARAQAQSQKQDQWRYVLHNREWWYWLPESRWVYWRGGQWNNYDPKTFTPGSPTPIASGGQAGSAHGNDVAPNSEIRPFYGHATSDWEYRPAGGDEIGPFYGHAMPGEVFGGWGGRRFGIRPFYGRAASSGD